VFVRLYEKDLVYRGKYLVNWCPSCGTALSDDEVEYREVHGRMYHYRYPISDGSGQFIQVATTRPETMLGDTAVAVHPDDDRYRGLVGRMVKLPLTEREIPIIADSYVDMTFGTGAVKVTPAHDPNDREMGIRHDLEVINILNPDATLNENVPEPYRGLPVKEARKRVVADLDSAGLFVEAKDHMHQVGHCYRCGTVIEPYLSEQWFVRMRPLAEKALQAWRSGEVVFYPRRWENTYTHWLEGIHDWCISRQLWWGHRIPVWYCDECGEVIVDRDDPSSCPKCGAGSLRQDPDVLDTWFSSWLWPFSTLGWPDNTEDLERFFPTTTLVTAYDIIFFWVARMIMSSMEFMGRAPFRDIYITSLIRDKQGRKMSKSLGNGIDPLEVVDRFGADALKFTLSFLSAQGQDILIEMESFSLGSRFCNKIWNATRYLLMNLEDRTFLQRDQIEMKDIDHWIYHRLNDAAASVHRAMASYRYDDASRACYEYFWNDFCDWYVEATKLSLYSEDEHEKDRAISLLMYVLEESLRLLHPFLPFLTEEIYQKLPDFLPVIQAETDATAHAGTSTTCPDRPASIMVSHYPLVDAARENGEVAARFSSLQELVRLVRTMRSEFTIPPSQKVRFHVKTDSGFDGARFFNEHVDLIRLLTSASEVTLGSAKPASEGAIPAVGVGFEVYVFVREVIDVQTEIAKLTRDIEKTTVALNGTLKKLGNPGFVSKADDSIVAKEREKKDELERRISKMKDYIRELQD
jgi:valyl-tRNA synthetase